jgi:hypothetical protein
MSISRHPTAVADKFEGAAGVEVGAGVGVGVGVGGGATWTIVATEGTPLELRIKSM